MVSLAHLRTGLAVCNMKKPKLLLTLVRLSESIQDVRAMNVAARTPVYSHALQVGESYQISIEELWIILPV
jgi:hypothetical protein